jgi:hypothetical protein
MNTKINLYVSAANPNGRYALSSVAECGKEMTVTDRRNRATQLDNQELRSVSRFAVTLGMLFCSTPL